MKKAISILLCVFWMGFIFYNSAQSGTTSNKLTNKIVDKIITVSEKAHEKGTENVKVYSKAESVKDYKEAIESNSLISNTKRAIQNKDKAALNLELRKAAHAFEFLILAVLLCNAFFVCGFGGAKAVIYILFIVLFYAVTDEFHQIYVAGRNSNVRDVLIDFCGGSIGLAGYYAIYYLLRKIRKKA